jgi:chromosome segregation ATPase
MRMNALQIISAKYLGGALLLLVLISASPSLADDPRAAQKRLNQADQALQAKTNEVVQATKGLERSIDIAKKRLNQLEVEGRLKDFEKMVKESRKHEEEAVEEAKKALEAAKRCDKLAFDQLSKKADGLLKKAKKTDDERKKFVKDMDEPVIKIDQLTRLGDTEQEEYKKAAEAAGFGDRFASVMNNFEKQKGALQREFEKQQEKLDTLQKAWEDLESKRSDIAKANAKLDEFGRPVSRPEEAESYLRVG